jgi:hypothetical protein
MDQIHIDFTIVFSETPEEGGGHGGHVPPPKILGCHYPLFGPRGADYARHITTGPPIILDDAASLVLNLISFDFKEGFALIVDDGLIWCISV